MSSTPQNRTKRRLKRLFSKPYYTLRYDWCFPIFFTGKNPCFCPPFYNNDYKFQFEKPFEEVFLNPSENVSINAIHFKAEAPKGVILYFHGNAGDLNRWGTIAELFRLKKLRCLYHGLPYLRKKYRQIKRTIVL